MYFLTDMQVTEDVVLLKTHMHNTKTKPYSVCKEFRVEVGLHGLSCRGKKERKREGEPNQLTEMRIYKPT